MFAPFIRFFYPIEASYIFSILNANDNHYDNNSSFVIIAYVIHTGQVKKNDYNSFQLMTFSMNFFENHY